jgi:hypothetical protein
MTAANVLDMMMTNPQMTFMLSDEDFREAERSWRRFAGESVGAGELAEELDYWTRQRALWQGDLAAADFTDDDAATLANGVAYADVQLRELTRQAERHARAMALPGYPPLRPQQDRAARFRAPKWADLVGLVQTLTGQQATKRGRLHLFCCPFHAGDREPSLTVYEPPRGWWCFGCQRGGDAVAFVAELNHTSVVRALEMVEILADTSPEAWRVA